MSIAPTARIRTFFVCCTRPQFSLLCLYAPAFVCPSTAYTIRRAYIHAALRWLCHFAVANISPCMCWLRIQALPDRLHIASSLLSTGSWLEHRLNMTSDNNGENSPRQLQGKPSASLLYRAFCTSHSP